jgi:hypothetical protein
MDFTSVLVILGAAASAASIVSSLYYSTKAILTSHETVSAKVDGVVGVVAAQQKGIDTLVKDVETIKAALMSK